MSRKRSGKKLSEFSKSDLEDLIGIFKILCGGALVAILFQGQPHGILVFVITYLLVKYFRKIKGD